MATTAALAETLEGFFNAAFPWRVDALEALAACLAGGAEPDGPLAGDVARVFATVGRRLATAEVGPSARRDVESVVYPGLWKLLDAARAGLPAWELRSRAAMVNVRLERLFGDGPSLV